METLNILEQKLNQLMALVKELKAKNAALEEDNLQLMQKVDSLESALLQHDETLEQEKALTKSAVDELIKSIDLLVSNENQP